METKTIEIPQLSETAKEIVQLYQSALDTKDLQQKEELLTKFSKDLIKLISPEYEPKFEIVEKNLADTMINGSKESTLFFLTGSAGDRIFFHSYNLDNFSKDEKIRWMQYPEPWGNIDRQKEQYKRWIDNFGDSYVDLKQDLG